MRSGLNDFFSVVKELVTGYHPANSTSGAAAASSSQTASVPDKGDSKPNAADSSSHVVRALNTGGGAAASSSQAASGLNAGVKINDKLTAIEVVNGILPRVLQEVICEYGDETRIDDESKSIQAKSQATTNGLFDNIATINAKRIARNLLWRLDIEKSLADAKEDSECLRVVVEVSDPHGQRVKGTVLQILLSAGDRNPREMKKGEPDIGLVERLRPCFATMPQEFDRQYQEWEKKREAETKKTHERFNTGMTTLLDKIIADDKARSDTVAFNDLLNLGIAEEFNEALKPDPNHVAEGGLLFDFPGMVLRLIDLLTQNETALGGYGSLKYDLFATMVYSALLKRLQRCDLEVVSAEEGIDGVVTGKCAPRQINYSKGIPDDLKGAGVDFIPGLFGGNLAFASPIPGFARPAWDFRAALDIFRSWSSKKHQPWTMQHSRSHSPSACLIM